MKVLGVGVKDNVVIKYSCHSFPRDQFQGQDYRMMCDSRVARFQITRLCGMHNFGRV